MRKEFIKSILEFYLYKYRVPYLEFILIIYFSLILFNFVAIPEKIFIKSIITCFIFLISFFVWLDCIKSWYEYSTLKNTKGNRKLVLEKSIIKTVILSISVIMWALNRVLTYLFSTSNLSSLGLIYFIFIILSSLIFIFLIVIFSKRTGFWKKGWISLLFVLYIYIAYSFALIYYIGDYYSISKGNGFSFSEKIENEILVRNVFKDFEKELDYFHESSLETIINEKQYKIGYTEINVEGNELNITTDKIGEGWSDYYYRDLIKSYNLFSISDVSDFEFTQDSFLKGHYNLDYNKFINGDFKLLKIILYKIPRKELDGSILKYEPNRLKIEQFAEKSMYLIISEDNFTNYTVLESQRDNYILFHELLAFSNVLLDDTINDINQIIYEGKSKSFIDYFYYSFVVITTLGFGDITPVSKLFRLLTILEAFLGLFIMGLYLSKVFDKEK